MSKQNLDPRRMPKLHLKNTHKRPHYRQPEVYSLGSLEQIQASYTGPYLDGASAASYYQG